MQTARRTRYLRLSKFERRRQQVWTSQRIKTKSLRFHKTKTFGNISTSNGRETDLDDEEGKNGGVTKWSVILLTLLCWQHVKICLKSLDFQPGSAGSAYMTLHKRGAISIQGWRQILADKSWLNHFKTSRSFVFVRRRVCQVSPLRTDQPRMKHKHKNAVKVILVPHF